jgi:hypothetical protein
MPEIGASGTVRGEGGNILTYSETGVAIPYREMAPPKDDPKPTKMQTRWPTFKELTDEHDRRMKHRRARI